MARSGTGFVSLWDVYKFSYLSAVRSLSWRYRKQALRLFLEPCTYWRNVEVPVHRLGVGELLRRSLSSTNAIESCLSTVQRVARNVKRWQEGNQIGILNVRLNPLIRPEGVRKEQIA